MSRGGASVGARQDLLVGEHAGRLLRELIRSGKSFSGRERNCCYVNFEGANWANASAVTGIDFPDDGRALAVTDWDRDGDLDLWLVNRSGPQIRFLENQLDSAKNSFVSFQLIGRDSNHDAIGARVELQLSKPKRTLIRTVRAGSGYLSQSSKTVHFGLPSESEIDQLRIRWPSGTVQQIGNVQTRSHYAITEGQTQLARRVPLDLQDPLAPRTQRESSVEQTGARSQVKIAPPARRDATTGSADHVLLTQPLPLPAIRYEDRAGQSAIVQSKDRHVLLSLWSKTCAPCLVELSKLDKNRAQFDAANVEIVALCVDQIGQSSRSSNESNDRTQLARFGLKIQGGNATDATVDLLQIANDVLFDLHQPLPLPCSFLIDREGRLAAVYKSSVGADRITRDVAFADASLDARRNAGMPFSGRWAGAPRSIRPLMLAHAMLDAGLIDQVVEYAQEQRPLLEQDQQYGVFLFNLGQSFTRQADHAAAISYYRAAIAYDPELASAHYNLAITLLQSSDVKQAQYHLEQTVRFEPDSYDAIYRLGLLAMQAGKVQEANQLFERVLSLNSHHADAHHQLAILGVIAGSLRGAYQHFEAAVEQKPDLYGTPAGAARMIAALEWRIKLLSSEPATDSDQLRKWQQALEAVTQGVKREE